MKTLVKLRHNNASHPMLEEATVYATAVGGNAAIVNEQAGERWFLLDEGVTEVTLGISITFDAAGSYTMTVTNAAGASHHERVEETWHRAWRVSDRYTVREGMLKRVESDVPHGESSLDLRARRSVVAASARDASTGAGSVATFDVDLSFLDATEMLRPSEHAQVAWDDCDGCVVRMYQYTGSGPCCAVAIVIPPVLRHGSAPHSVDSLLFFAPQNSGYNSVHEVATFQLSRYLRRVVLHEGAQFSGFWQQTGQANPVAQANAYPYCRFASQLRDSGRKVMLVMPQANGSSYSPFTSGTWTSAGSRNGSALLDSLIKAVQADGLLAGGARARRATRGRVGVSGFSSGGGAALRCFASNPSRTHDLYLFDPNDLEPGSQNALRIVSWVQQRGRRVRFIGGMHCSAILTTARACAEAIGVAPETLIDGRNDHRPGESARDMSVVVLPTSAAFFDRSSDYRAAFVFPTGPLLTPLGAPHEGRLSTLKSIHLAPPSAAGEVHVTDAHGAVESFPGFSTEEVAASLYFTYIIHADAHEHAPGFRACCNEVRSRRGAGIPFPYSLRHQWTVFGGQSRGDHHDASFRGYLQICLETSGFAR